MPGQNARNNAKREMASFTLVELLVSISIIAVMAAMLLTAANLAQESARTSYCSNNLRQMGQAIFMYENVWRAMPLGDLPISLKPYDGNKKLYVCPNDKTGTDSYSPFYVCRSEQDATRYVIGCTRHNGGEKAAVLYGMAAAKTHRAPTIYDRNGDPVKVGEEYSNEEFNFTDGSIAKVAGSGAMIALASFQQRDGTVYNVVKVKREHHCTISSTVNHGSSYEVVTPSAVASALGTKYSVTAGNSGGNYTSTLNVTEGVVGFAGRVPGAKSKRVKAGGNGNISEPKGKCPKD